MWMNIYGMDAQVYLCTREALINKRSWDSIWFMTWWVIKRIYSNISFEVIFSDEFGTSEPPIMSSWCSVLILTEQQLNFLHCIAGFPSSLISTLGGDSCTHTRNLSTNSHFTCFSVVLLRLKTFTIYILLAGFYLFPASNNNFANFII